MRLIPDVFAYAAKEMPRWNTISIRGIHIREAARRSEEVAYHVGDGIGTSRRALEVGLDVNEFGTQTVVFFNVRTTIFWRKSLNSGRRVGWGPDYA